MYYIQVTLKVELNEILDYLKKHFIIHKNRKLNICDVVECNGKHFFIHYKEYFSLFSFVNFNRIEKNKIKMTQNDFEQRDKILKEVCSKNYLGVI